MARVFISHSSRDGGQAERLHQWLRDQGSTETFLDIDKHAGLMPGDDWERRLYREIAAAEAVILILTKNWFESKWCFAEFIQARALGKAIFPIIETSDRRGIRQPRHPASGPGQGPRGRLGAPWLGADPARAQRARHVSVGQEPVAVSRVACLR